jgi:hypothetical protein
MDRSNIRCVTYRCTCIILWHLQQRSVTRFWERPASARATIRHDSVHPICWIHCHASPRVSFVLHWETAERNFFQEHVPALVGETLCCHSVLYACMGHNISINRFVGTDRSRRWLLMVLRDHNKVHILVLHYSDIISDYLIQVILGLLSPAFFLALPKRPSSPVLYFLYLNGTSGTSWPWG